MEIYFSLFIILSFYCLHPPFSFIKHTSGIYIFYSNFPLEKKCSETKSFSISYQILRQIYDTAMCSQFAPDFANVFMHHCEEYIFNHALDKTLQFIWQRCIDDIFVIWRHGEMALNQFLDFLNRCFPTISSLPRSHLLM